MDVLPLDRPVGVLLEARSVVYIFAPQVSQFVYVLPCVRMYFGRVCELEYALAAKREAGKVAYSCAFRYVDTCARVFECVVCACDAPMIDTSYPSSIRNLQPGAGLKW